MRHNNTYNREYLIQLEELILDNKLNFRIKLHDFVMIKKLLNQIA